MKTEKNPKGAGRKAVPNGVRCNLMIPRQHVNTVKEFVKKLIDENK